MAAKLREKKAFTNTATFDLKCQVRAFAPACPSQLLTLGSRNAGKDSKGRRKLVNMLRKLGTRSSASISVNTDSILYPRDECDDCGESARELVTKSLPSNSDLTRDYDDTSNQYRIAR